MEGLRCQESPGDERPECLPGMARREMEPDPTGSALDANADLEQPKTQGIHLGVSQLSTVSGTTKHVHEDVASGVQEQAKLVGPEAMAAQAVGLVRPLEILDGVLGGIGALHVAAVVELLGIEDRDPGGGP